ncbi:MAG: ABC transporter permease subunit [Chloroflexi bacterium]|nr:ABC transporter permease subunit [Chloroflexota bacterium]
MSTLYLISLRQLTGRPRMVIIGLISAVPILMGLAVRLVDDGPNATELDNTLLGLLFGVAVLPIIALTVSTAALGNDLEDRTLSNLTLTPSPRWQIILPKLAAAVTVGAPPILISAVAATFLAYDGEAQTIVAVAVGIALALLAYSAVFLWLGLSTGRALGYGLMYVFLWEFLFTGFVSGVRFLSIRAYMIGIIRGIDDNRFTEDANQVISFPVSIIVTAAVIVIFTLLTVRRLRTMDVP